MTTTSRRALIVGITGQDGPYLAEYLLKRGYEVHGTSRNPESNSGNLLRLGIADRVHLHALSPQEMGLVMKLLQTIRPREIYNLSGQSSVGLSFSRPQEAISSNMIGALNVLEAIRLLRLDARFYNASSSEIFGDMGAAPSSEDTPFAPRSPYGLAKTASTMQVRMYRETYGLFACSGIMFNHESPLRPDGFVAHRIVRGAIEIAQKRADRLRLGNLRIVRDWGWAPDFVEGMWMMLQQDRPRDFVFATGIGTSLEALVDRVFSRFGLNWREYVVCEETLMRPSDIAVSIGNPQRARAEMGWTARVRMPEIADRLVEAALSNSG